MKLISMTDFVIRLNQNKNYVDENGNMPFYHTAINHYQNSNRSEDYRCLVRYANFLKQHLKLEMFVPCNDNGNILDDPGLIPSYELEQYRKAKEKVLFVGFDDIEAINYHISRKRNIEYLSKFGSIELTQNAIRQFM